MNHQHFVRISSGFASTSDDLSSQATVATSLDDRAKEAAEHKAQAAYNERMAEHHRAKATQAPQCVRIRRIYLFGSSDDAHPFCDSSPASKLSTLNFSPFRRRRPALERQVT